MTCKKKKKQQTVISASFDRQSCAALQAGFDIYATMQPRGIRPNLSTFHSLLKGTSFLKAPGLRQLYSQMLSLQHIRPTDVTFHYVLRAAARCCNGLPAAWLFQVTFCPRVVVPCCTMTHLQVHIQGAVAHLSDRCQLFCHRCHLCCGFRLSAGYGNGLPA